MKPMLTQLWPQFTADAAFMDSYGSAIVERVVADRQNKIITVVYRTANPVPAETSGRLIDQLADRHDLFRQHIVRGNVRHQRLLLLRQRPVGICERTDKLLYGTEGFQFGCGRAVTLKIRERSSLMFWCKTLRRTLWRRELAHIGRSWQICGDHIEFQSLSCDCCHATCGHLRFYLRVRIICFAAIIIKRILKPVALLQKEAPQGEKERRVSDSGNID